MPSSSASEIFQRVVTEPHNVSAEMIQHLEKSELTFFLDDQEVWGIKNPGIFLIMQKCDSSVRQALLEKLADTPLPESKENNTLSLLDSACQLMNTNQNTLFIYLLLCSRNDSDYLILLNKMNHDLLQTLVSKQLWHLTKLKSQVFEAFMNKLSPARFYTAAQNELRHELFHLIQGIFSHQTKESILALLKKSLPLF